MNKYQSNRTSLERKSNLVEKISLLVPMFNEEQVIPAFFNEVLAVLNELNVDWEIICVNDGSKDRTLEMLSQKNLLDSRIKIINFSRNFGKERALTAAIDFATGDAVIPIDADLQDPPELIPLMIQRWHEGYDIVNAVRAHRKTDTLLKRFTAKMFYRAINAISEIHIPSNAGDYRLLSRRVCDALHLLGERRRFMKGLFSWVGYPTATIEYSRKARVMGNSKFSYWKLWNFAIEGITSFSTAPLRLASYLGLISAISSFFYALIIVVKTMIFGNPVSGYPSLMTAILFLGGVQLIFIGIIGEYIGRIHDEVKGRPIYIIESAIGFEPKINGAKNDA
jgi:polyisoprenyl-phosphate glycosyltransferase